MRSITYRTKQSWLHLRNFILRHGIRAYFSVALIAILSLTAWPCAATPQPPIKQILILHSYHQGMQWTDSVHQALIKELTTSDFVADIYVEYMDAIRFKPNVESDAALLKKLTDRNGSAQFDLIIVSDNDAFNFILKHRPQIAPSKPIVFCGINHLKAEDIASYSNLIGVSETPSFYETLALAKKLHPQVNHIFVVGDRSATFKGNQRGIEAAIGHFDGQLHAEYSTLENIRKLEHRLQNLNKNSLVFMAGKPTDEDGVALTVAEATARVSQASRVPVYSGWDFRLGYGIVGGHLISGDAQGHAAGQLALQLLHGQSINHMQIVGASPNQPMFDYKLMRRFHIKESALPADSVIINKPESFYEKNKVAVLATISTISLLTLLIIFLTFNIFKRQRAEAEVIRLNADLEQRVQQRTADFEAVNNELKAFTYSVSHDLRAPLRRIDGFSTMLLQDLSDSPPLSNQAKHYLNRLRTGVQAMSDMIDSFLKLTQATPESSQIQQINLSTLAEEIISELKLVTPNRAINVHIEPDIYVQGDLQMLRIALRNLLDNAWKYTRATLQPSIYIGRKPGEQNVYMVRDNGAGFEMDAVGKLFKPFSRLHDVNDFEGYGIGLATVQRIINRHQGRIWAESEPNKETSFYFTLREM